ncbi:MAG TPA: hypothetical protein VEI02_00615, partial [Planctomycetota bacterium]|nr:hypothetical protein [Planctomycetota bacterium]
FAAAAFYRAELARAAEAALRDAAEAPSDAVTRVTSTLALAAMGDPSAEAAARALVARGAGHEQYGYTALALAARAAEVDGRAAERRFRLAAPDAPEETAAELRALFTAPRRGSASRADVGRLLATHAGLAAAPEVGAVLDRLSGGG